MLDRQGSGLPDLFRGPVRVRECESRHPEFAKIPLDDLNACITKLAQHAERSLKEAAPLEWLQWARGRGLDDEIHPRLNALVRKYWGTPVVIDAPSEPSRSETTPGIPENTEQAGQDSEHGNSLSVLDAELGAKTRKQFVEMAKLRQAELYDWIPKNRGRLISAALTILKAYEAAGRPDVKLTPYGSFNEWSALVRAALVWVGHTDPCQTRTRLEGADHITGELGTVLTVWHRELGSKKLTVREVVDQCGMAAHAELIYLIQKRRIWGEMHILNDM